MQYVSFRIQNFKGIKDTTISFETVAGASVFSFVGLNESGKTTVLEAIHSFAPDQATSELLGGEEGLGVPFKERVPRHMLSEFTGGVKVAATLSISQPDKLAIKNALLADHSLDLDLDHFPDRVSFEREQKFENGDFKRSYFTLWNEFQVRSAKQRKWRKPENSEKVAIRDTVFRYVPRIAYFPTFVFEFPKSIFLTDRGDVVDKFYRRVFQDILDSDGRGQTIEKDIVRRIRREEMIVPWLSFWSAWGAHDDREKIQQVVDRASSAVTKMVFGRWNKIFGEDTRGKEVSITFDVLEGETEDSKGAKTKTNEHDVQVKFQIKDGTRRYDVNDRSLGFRWFFSFMLFTQFRVARSGKDAVSLLFLFDEPAANLHAAAQQKLIESFPEIAKNGHVLAYSTHSHYMIEPKWLEQTFIVTNRADAPVASLLDEISLDDESLDVKADAYRSFVNQHPGQTSYFQPILDRLNVVPSKFDMREASVVLEGRSDYYVLRYAERMLNMLDLPLLPGLGAGTFGALAAFHVGWNLNFMFLLDGDKQGVIERDRYRDEFGIPSDRLAILSDLVSGVKTIEDLLDDEARQTVQVALGLASRPNKAQIKRFFQERLASDQVCHLGAGFETRARSVLQELRARLGR
jgi:ABC-type Na+ transport system ATPase subunit NatA